ncbi:MAG: hypothetical protein QCI82_07645 [Candidatus Thermoplasmatota archaeon]|nr:hypothetical protein [Candidatus Thermoplasmatota archaeon]
MIPPEIGLPDQVKIKYPDLLDHYEKNLQRWIGCLSSFIVRKQYERLRGKGRNDLDRDKAGILLDMVSQEASLLIGDVQARELKRSLIEVTEEYFRKGDEVEG